MSLLKLGVTGMQVHRELMAQRQKLMGASITVSPADAQKYATEVRQQVLLLDHGRCCKNLIGFLLCFFFVFFLFSLSTQDAEMELRLKQLEQSIDTSKDRIERMESTIIAIARVMAQKLTQHESLMDN
jgi:large-conductance mechanosensitive channel